jgi:hypothetical protein
VIRAVAASLLACWTASAGAAISATAPATHAPAQWRFQVYLDGDRIGYHNFTLASTPDGRQLTSEARFVVRLLKIPVYRYRHDAVELWDGPCLQRIESSTDDNGEALSVQGRANGERFRLRGTAGEKTLSGCVMSFAYWDSRILQAQRLLNAQNGEYLPVEVTDLGSDPLKVADQTVSARRYRLTGENLQIELWYSDDHRWLALQSTTPSGYTLYYERENFDAR